MRVFLKAALAALALVGPALGETPVTYTDAGRALFRFDVPDFWLLRNGGPRDVEDTRLGDVRAVSRIMGLRPVSDDSVWMGFVSPAGVSDIQGGLQYLLDLEKFLVRDPVISGQSETRVGGLPARVIRGSGRRDGKDVAFTATVIDLPNGRVAVAVTILRAGSDPALAEDMNAVFASFRAAQ